MSRVAQGHRARGSQRWMQFFVNSAPQVLDDKIGLGPIEWRSPLADDEYAEYRDAPFLERLGIKLPHRALETFWPRRGPQWDALGRAASGEAVLVEAKAHLGELLSTGCRASDASLAVIRESLADAACALHVSDGCDWSRRFYQYANRIAHAWFLAQVNAVPVRLVFIYFAGDPVMKGSATEAKWRTAIGAAHAALGLDGHPPFVREVFIDVTAFHRVSE